jgi:hypothetical protein
MLRSDITFIKESHEYFIGSKRLPSVSEIMRPLTEPAMAAVPLSALEKARDRGIKVHQAIEDWVNLDIYDEEVGDYLDQFILMLLENDLQVVHSEIMLTNGEYAGTLDLIVKNDKNKLYIVDTKTTYAISTYVPIQLGAYYNLAQYNGFSIQGCYVFHVKSDGYNLTVRHPDVEQWEKLYEKFKNEANQY